ncbi:hypothetical protein LV457_17855 [Mycobacterium sp. MYCO198283]|uniref:hypothetical protein n=1 Tax=Mycobacterium sp. MYCO198283 TaxID=2883505 RepID=UPI001E409DC5|nr:hypothetical protein [Mycobacterium sp. MYCO198283]MCG5434141.1 hypothetical protein [Mycobacterium sp. MYCO198283]
MSRDVPPRDDQSDATRRIGNPYDLYGHSAGDPAYAGQSPWAPTGPPPQRPTEQLPPYWTQTNPQAPLPDPGDEPPHDERPSKWLWIFAGVAVVLVIGLAVALVIVTSSSKEETVVSPLPALTPTATTSTSRSPTAVVPPSSRPTSTTSASPTTTSGTASGATQTVVYEVSGTGRALSITYADSESMAMEFNVQLPWRKELTLPQPAESAASVSIVTYGGEVTCSVFVDGSQVKQQTGNTFTSC